MSKWCASIFLVRYYMQYKFSWLKLLYILSHFAQLLPNRVEWDCNNSYNVSGCMSWIYLGIGEKGSELTSIHHLIFKALLPGEKSSFIWSYLQYLSPFFFTPLNFPFQWEQKLELQPISQQDLSENSNTFRQNYSRFPSEACWSFSPCPAEACGSWLTSRCVPENVPEEKKKKRERKTVDYISTVPPLNNSSHSSVQPPLQKPHLNKQTLQCSEIIMQPTIRCLFTWTQDHGSLGFATISPKTDRAWK